MPLFDSVFSSSSPCFRRFLRGGATFAFGCAVLASNSIGFAGESDKPAASQMEPGRLRMEARLAAEQGDFRTAAENLEAAALKVGDRKTADRARASREKLEAGGGAQLDFDSLIQLIMEQTSPPATWEEDGGDFGTITPFFQGVFFGTPSMACALTMTYDNSRLLAAAELARTSNPNDDVQESSELRLVSLPRLEQHVKSLMAAGQPIPDDVACLAGLTEVQFLFVFPETQDVVIGGPAGAWKNADNQRSVSVSNGRPTLRFDDLVTLSRTFAPGGSGFFMCSIDPKPEQVKAVRDYAAKTELTSGNVRKVTDKLEEMLGLQNVIVQGIPQDSRVASVIVEADYQMKLIGIGEREGAEGMKSYFDLVSRAERKGSAMDALRWWMTVGYDSIHVSPDRQSFEFNGKEVQCQSENQLVASDGTRQATGKADNANTEFARLFTEHLPELSAQDVVFADLQNVFDLGLATALVHTMGLNRQVGWQPEVLGAAGSYSPAPVEVPAELMTAASSRVYGGREIVIQVAGGVRGDLRSVVKNPDNFEVSAEVVKKAIESNPVGQSGRWWWDAAAR
ncbi:MAG: DUF1598 domain-containing protein [Planctomycetaceae bacterium]